MPFNGHSLFFTSQKVMCVFGAEGEMEGYRKMLVGMEEIFSMFVSHNWTGEENLRGCKGEDEMIPMPQKGLLPFIGEGEIW